MKIVLRRRKKNNYLVCAYNTECTVLSGSGKNYICWPVKTKRGHEQCPLLITIKQSLPIKLSFVTSSTVIWLDIWR